MMGVFIGVQFRFSQDACYDRGAPLFFSFEFAHFRRLRHVLLNPKTDFEKKKKKHALSRMEIPMAEAYNENRHAFFFLLPIKPTILG